VSSHSIVQFFSDSIQLLHFTCGSRNFQLKKRVSATILHIVFITEKEKKRKIKRLILKNYLFISVWYMMFLWFKFFVIIFFQFYRKKSIWINIGDDEWDHRKWEIFLFNYKQLSKKIWFLFPSRVSWWLSWLWIDWMRGYIVITSVGFGVEKLEQTLVGIFCFLNIHEETWSNWFEEKRNLIWIVKQNNITKWMQCCLGF
jgi:hypothetical protein